MTEEDRLRVQLSTNLSLALIAAAFTMLAGVVAAFVILADKIPTSYGWLIGGAAFVASLCLILSIFFGGVGISKTGKAVQHHQKGTPFPEHYAGGNFDRQALTGLVGLVIGVLIFICLGMGVIAKISAERAKTSPGAPSMASDVQKFKVSPGKGQQGQSIQDFGSWELGGVAFAWAGMAICLVGAWWSVRRGPPRVCR